MPKIFVSHCSADHQLAAAIVRLLEKALRLDTDAIRCTSIDGYGLSPGVLTDTVLRQEIQEAAAFVGLLTPSSIASTYVLFELGARWGAGRHFVPLASGLQLKDLDGPLRGLNVLTAHNISHLHSLVESVGAVVNVATQAPFSWNDEVLSVTAAASALRVHKQVSAVEPLREVAPQGAYADISTIEATIRDVCTGAARMTPDFYVEPNINGSLLRSLEGIYDGLETVMAVIDTTSKEGPVSAVVMTHRGVYWRNSDDKYTEFLSWNRLGQVRIRADSKAHGAFLGADGYIDLGCALYVQSDDLSKVLRTIAKRIRAA